MALRGHVDVVERNRITGWAFDDEEPAAKVGLVVSIDGQVVGRSLADLHRVDLAAAGIGDGTHAFHFAVAAGLMPIGRCVVAVRREGDGGHLVGSPTVVEAPSAFDECAKATITAVLSASGETADRRSRISFLAELLDRMNGDHAERTGYISALLAKLRAEHAARGLPEQADGSEDAAGDAPPISATVTRRALVIDAVMPTKARDAGSNAVVSHMRALQRLGYAVSFVPTTLDGDPGMLDAAGIACFLQPSYSCVEDVLRRHADSFVLVYLHRGDCAASYLQLVRRQQPHARIIYSVADLHHLRLARQAQVEERPELHRYAEGMRGLELTAAHQADAVITHSRTEMQLLGQQLPPGRVHLVPWTVSPHPTAVGLRERHGFAFIGSYGHAPNADAARWLVEMVVPELARRGRPLTCLLVGSAMPEHLRRLATGETGNGVEAVGKVADLAEVFDRVRLTVAPLAYGAGIKGKVLDSLAAGVPCVCSPVAAEGLDLPSLLLQLVASTPEEMATTIRRLHDNEALNQACSEAGLAYIRETMSEGRIDELLRAVVRQVEP